jgi:hypothetical protein
VEYALKTSWNIHAYHMKQRGEIYNNLKLWDSYVLLDMGEPENIYMYQLKSEVIDYQYELKTSTPAVRQDLEKIDRRNHML